jgi:hypothetical protein
MPYPTSRSNQDDPTWCEVSDRDCRIVNLNRSTISRMTTEVRLKEQKKAGLL